MVKQPKPKTRQEAIERWAKDSRVRMSRVRHSLDTIDNIIQTTIYEGNLTSARERLLAKSLNEFDDQSGFVSGIIFGPDRSDEDDAADE